MKRFLVFLDMIKFEHTLFALPLAYMGLFLAADGLPTLCQFIWVSLCMVSLRTAAMSLNRLVDRRQDAKNPRTQDRALPQRKLSESFVWSITLAMGGLFVFGAAQLNHLCLALSPLALAMVIVYPFTKRWTVACHFMLGFILASAPLGGWIAARGTVDWEVLPLVLAIVFWVAGFDVIYALQDMEFDRHEKLFSIPACLGVQTSLRCSQLFHALTVVFLIWFGLSLRLGPAYWVGLVCVAFLLLQEQRLAFTLQTDKINQAFFHVNAWVSVVLFVATFVDVLVR